LCLRCRRECFDCDFRVQAWTLGLRVYTCLANAKPCSFRCHLLLCLSLACVILHVVTVVRLQKLLPLNLFSSFHLRNSTLKKRKPKKYQDRTRLACHLTWFTLSAFASMIDHMVANIWRPTLRPSPDMKHSEVVITVGIPLI
jgi:hypothetical protein